MRSFISSICLVSICNNSYAEYSRLENSNLEKIRVDNIKKQLKFDEGDYRKIKGPEEKCQGDILSLEYAGNFENVVLKLGEKFIFTHLEKTTFNEPGLSSCVFQTDTLAKEKNIQQTTKYKCPKTTDGYEKKQSLLMMGDILTFSFHSSGDGGASFDCQYKKQSLKDK